MDNVFSNLNILKVFSTSNYRGAWFHFSGNRMELRRRIQEHLQIELSDPNGLLVVQEKGPEWIGSKEIRISYSHSGCFALLVWLNTHQIGVDLEKKDREYSHHPLQLAKRFFHPDETRAIQEKAGNPQELNDAFLDLWLKKEAYAKLTRNGLKESIHMKVDSISDVSFEAVPVTPAGYEARIAIRQR